MEWYDFDESSFGDSSLFEIENNHDGLSSEWSLEENKLFENALAEFHPESPGFYENVASRIPWKNIEDIKKHYQALVDDVDMIENGDIPIPNYNQQNHDEHVQQQQQKIEIEEQNGNENVSHSLLKRSKDSASAQNHHHQRRRGVPWTEEEHQLFLMGLNKYGKGDWRSISRYYVITKTPTQVASHAQKYFRRQNSSTPADRRRPSIHDIQTVNPNFISMPQLGHFSCDREVLPFLHPYGSNSISNNNNNNYTNGFGELGHPTTTVSPMNSSYPVGTNPMMMMMNQPSMDAYNSMSYMLPSLGSNNWG